MKHEVLNVLSPTCLPVVDIARIRSWRHGASHGAKICISEVPIMLDKKIVCHVVSADLSTKYHWYYCGLLVVFSPRPSIGLLELQPLGWYQPNQGNLLGSGVSSPPEGTCILKLFPGLFLFWFDWDQHENQFESVCQALRTMTFPLAKTFAWCLERRRLIQHIYESYRYSAAVLCCALCSNEVANKVDSLLQPRNSSCQFKIILHNEPSSKTEGQDRQGNSARRNKSETPRCTFIATIKEISFRRKCQKLLKHQLQNEYNKCGVWQMLENWHCSVHFKAIQFANQNRIRNSSERAKESVFPQCFILEQKTHLQFSVLSGQKQLTATSLVAAAPTITSFSAHRAELPVRSSLFTVCYFTCLVRPLQQTECFSSASCFMLWHVLTENTKGTTYFALACPRRFLECSGFGISKENSGPWKFLTTRNTISGHREKNSQLLFVHPCHQLKSLLEI